MLQKVQFTVALLFSILWVNSYGQSTVNTIIPKHYICYKTTQNLCIDGLINEREWLNAEWTDLFIDIEGDKKPLPRFNTKVKMLWDSNYLYIACYLNEPHVWANLTERESVIFYDNDFEVFIDPDGDTHKYLEFEMNALNTQWDLLLLKPYRDESGGNVAIDNWSYNGIKSAVHIDGTLNNPSDIDSGWSLEIAIPMDAIIEVGNTGKQPKNGEHYRINFSRVEWQTDVIAGKYVKRTKIINDVKITLPEDNWVWSNQGAIAMHQPETWGYLQFSEKIIGTEKDTFIPDPDEQIKSTLRKLYFKQSEFLKQHQKYASTLKDLYSEKEIESLNGCLPEIQTTLSQYEATASSNDKMALWHISQDGRIWKTKK